MPVWKMNAADYYTIKASERHHFIHANATTRSADKATFHMTFSRNVAGMLRQELGVALIEFVHRDAQGNPCPHDHPPGVRQIPHPVLTRHALNAPGFNHPDKVTRRAERYAARHGKTTTKP